MTTVTVAAEALAATAPSSGDATAVQKQIEAWKKTAERYDSDEKSREGRKELVERAKQAEEERDVATAKYHHYELASAAFQIGIVALVWFGGLLGAIGVVLLVLGLWAPHAVPFIATL